MNINIHGKDTFLERNHGLIRITGLLTAMAALLTMENHLQQNYEIEKSDHIFAKTAVMNKCGRLSEAKY